ncbi:MAG: hypothetical protein IPL46_25105 [Saprospiraceae bacterium]|nr:hypothetical protein [Saprospiraceae bacterium]
MHFLKSHLLALVILTLMTVSSNGQEPFAWCIVPFDKNERSPQERIDMLQDLGIKTYAYDWREKHLAEMSDEFTLAQQNNMTINAVWMWIDPKVDAIKKIR